MTEKHIYGESETPGSMASATNTNMVLATHSSAFQYVVVACGGAILVILVAILWQLQSLSSKIEEFNVVQSEVVRDVMELKTSERKLKNSEIKQSDVKKILQYIEGKNGGKD